MILLRIPAVGLFRFEPLRDLKRLWLWLTAPDTCRLVVCSTLDGQDRQIRTMTDADLILSLYHIRLNKRISWFTEGFIELRRRGLALPNKLPPWIFAVQAAAPYTSRLAERILRPEAERPEEV